MYFGIDKMCVEGPGKDKIDNTLIPESSEPGHVFFACLDITPIDVHLYLQ